MLVLIVLSSLILKLTPSSPLLSKGREGTALGANQEGSPPWERRGNFSPAAAAASAARVLNGDITLAKRWRRDWRP